MPNQRQPKSIRFPYRPDAGVKTDFENILERFAESCTVRYERFAEIWKDMKMHFYCAGRQNQREAREFMEDCFKIAVQFCIPPSSFLVRVGAIYLLYGLYHFQVVSPRVRIQITPEIWETLLNFQSEIREQQHLDLDYIFTSLIVDRAFQFSATPMWCYPCFKETEENSLISENLKETCNAVEEIFSSSCLNQLSLIHDQYHKMKVVLNGEESTKPDSSLDIIHQDLIQGVYKTLKLHKDRASGITPGVSNKAKSGAETDGEEMGTSEEPKMSLQRSLKKKAFAFTTFKGYGLKEECSEADPKMSQSKRRQYRKHKALQMLQGPDMNILFKRRQASGRSAHKFLYRKDELDNKAEMSVDLMKEVMNIPDEDIVVYKSTESSGSETEGTLNKGKKLVKGKAKKKSSKTKSGTETESDTNTEIDKQHNVSNDSKSVGSSPKKRPNKVEIDLRSDSDKSESPRKRKRISNQLDTSLENDNDSIDDTKQPKKDKKKKKMTIKEEKPDYDLDEPGEQKTSVNRQKNKSPKKPGKKSIVKSEIVEDQVEPTAQEKLNKKLVQRLHQKIVKKSRKPSVPKSKKK